jgi:uncharacterized protein (UPF0332 family)
MDSEFGKNALKNMFDVWIEPEIIKREIIGEITTPFAVTGAQVIFPPDDRPVVIRLNEEVKYELINGAARLVPEENSFGHMTFFLLSGKPSLSFDFRYSRDVSKEKLRIAEQFISTASFSLEKGHINALVENLFSVYELVAISLLIQHRVKIDKTHKSLGSKINQWMKSMPNFDQRFIQYFNIISRLRERARYNTEKTIEEYDFADMIRVASDSTIIIGRHL